MISSIGAGNGGMAVMETATMSHIQFKLSSYLDTGSNTKIIIIVDNTIWDLKVKVTIMNITQLWYAHTSVYGERKGKLLTTFVFCSFIYDYILVHFYILGLDL